MCDTLVALGDATADGGVLFAKNSDRERNEAQYVEMTPRRRGEAGDMLKLTYIAIPDLAETHACLLSRPFWMWGAEMGANEHGVVIGNEAVHATLPAQRRRALIGMDLVRLGLERGATAAEAIEVMTTLLERHGQGGDCGHRRRFYYNNSFIIADPHEAYVLETVGRWWVVKRVEGARALSNALSIGADFDACSAGLSDHARDEGWSSGDGRFDFAGKLLDEERDAVTCGRARCARGQTLLDAKRGRLGADDMMAILRDHGPAAEGDPTWTPAQTIGRTICMHAGDGLRRSQSVGSMVSELRNGRAVHWLTASSAPCLSLSKPVLFETGLPSQGASPSDAADGSSRWWRHEHVHRAALDDYAETLARFAVTRDSLEAVFRRRVNEALATNASATNLRAVVQHCWDEADVAEASLHDDLTKRGAARPMRGAYAQSWRRLNKAAGLA
jgi:dipeptidase